MKFSSKNFSVCSSKDPLKMISRSWPTVLLFANFERDCFISIGKIRSLSRNKSRRWSPIVSPSCTLKWSRKQQAMYKVGYTLQSRLLFGWCLVVDVAEAVFLIRRLHLTKSDYLYNRKSMAYMWLFCGLFSTLLCRLRWDKWWLTLEFCTHQKATTALNFEINEHIGSLRLTHGNNLWSVLYNELYLPFGKLLSWSTYSVSELWDKRRLAWLTHASSRFSILLHCLEK